MGREEIIEYLESVEKDLKSEYDRTIALNGGHSGRTDTFGYWSKMQIVNQIIQHIKSN